MTKEAAIWFASCCGIREKAAVVEVEAAVAEAALNNLDSSRFPLLQSRHQGCRLFQKPPSSRFPSLPRPPSMRLAVIKAVSVVVAVISEATVTRAARPSL